MWPNKSLQPNDLDIKRTKLSKRQFSLFNSYINGDLHVDEFPNYLTIETTNLCNLKCIMCPRSEMTRKVGVMDYTLFRKIIDEIEGKIEFIWLHFMGEPLLNKNLFDYIQYAAGRGTTVAISTNAAFLDESADHLLESELDFLIICLDSLNEGTYQKIRVNSNFYKTLNNIERFVARHLATRSHLNVSLQLVKMNLNENEIDTFISKWPLRSGINVVVKSLHGFADQMKTLKELGYVPFENSKRKLCAEPWRGMIVGWDGNVVPCCNDFDYKYVLGNVRETS